MPSLTITLFTPLPSTPSNTTATDIFDRSPWHVHVCIIFSQKPVNNVYIGFVRVGSRHTSRAEKAPRVKSSRASHSGRNFVRASLFFDILFRIFSGATRFTSGSLRGIFDVSSGHFYCRRCSNAKWRSAVRGSRLRGSFCY